MSVGLIADMQYKYWSNVESILDNVNYNSLGAGVIISLFLIKELFVFLKSIFNKNGDGLTEIAKTMNNSMMMLELIREQQRTHEANAHNRHIDIASTVSGHSAECREQARRLQEHLK